MGQALHSNLLFMWPRKMAAQKKGFPLQSLTQTFLKFQVPFAYKI